MIAGGSGPRAAWYVGSYYCRLCISLPTMWRHYFYNMTLSKPLQEVMAARVAVSLAFNLLRFGVAVLLLSVAVTAARVPGLEWDALEAWEASALPGAWDDVDGYLDFRTCALNWLSDLGFLDDLKTTSAPILRVIADCGDYTARHGRPPGRHHRRGFFFAWTFVSVEG